MPVSRMRMRPWLEQMIDSQSISGLNWFDKEKTMFTIPWKHAARHGWEMDKDACLFKKWAIHTGKYVEGQTCDPKTWKANFRCAMNSLPDIEEVKDRSINKGHQAMRVFKMLPCSPKPRDKRSKAKDTKSRTMRSAVKMEEDDYSDAQSPMDESMQEDTLSTQENTVDSTVNTEQKEFPYVPLSEVPDCSSTVDIWAGSPDNFYHKFEVSPEHDTDYDTSDEIIKICQQLERETQWYSLDDTGFLSNEACGSPLSQWSESSSADDLDDLPQYTTLGSGIRTHTDDLLTSFWSPKFPNFL